MPNTDTQPKNPVDVLWGVDRYADSPARGDLVVPNIFLWRAPACVWSPDNLTGALAHGSEVEILRIREKNDGRFAQIRGSVWIETLQETRTFEGWIRTTLLKNEGLNDAGVVDTGGEVVYTDAQDGPDVPA